MTAVGSWRRKRSPPTFWIASDSAGPVSVTVAPFSIAGVKYTGSVLSLCELWNVIVVFWRSRGQATGLPIQPQRWTFSAPHVSRGPTPLPAAPHVAEEPLLASLAHPVEFAGSMNHAGTVQLGGMTGVLEEPTFMGRCALGPTQPEGVDHAACASCAGVRVSAGASGCAVTGRGRRKASDETCVAGRVKEVAGVGAFLDAPEG
jgi:hypothetical protein